MSKRKREDKLIKFVWGRNRDYDRLLLLEVQSRNPYAAQKQKPVWEATAKALQGCELKMKVTARSCRDRVADLLKKYRKEEAATLRTSGAADDDTSEVNGLLTCISEMQRVKPDRKQAAIYSNKSKRDGESIRTAALNNLTDSEDSTDGTQYFRRSSSSPCPGLLYGDEMSLQEEYLMDQQLIREYEVSTSQTIDVDDDDNDPSTSQADSMTRHPTSSRHGASSRSTEDLELQRSDVIGGYDNGNTSETSMDQQTADDRSRLQADSMTRQPTSSRHDASSRSTENLQLQRSDGNKTSLSKGKESQSEANPNKDRFSNPKKDLILYLERKSQNEIDVRKDEIRIREMDAQNKKAELEILRLKTEADIEEKKRMNELIITLLTKHQHQ